MDSLNPTRRLEGFVVAVEGEKTKVALLENGSLQYYRVDTKKLAKKSITEKNQPFEMSEFEVKIDGESHFIYVYKPLASKSDKRKQPLPMTPERREKLAFILRDGKDAEA